MKSSKLVPGLDKEISQLALGTGWMADAAPAVCFELFDAYRALGGTVIDTGRIYGSEGAVGAWLKRAGSRDDLVIMLGQFLLHAIGIHLDIQQFSVQPWQHVIREGFAWLLGRSPASRPFRDWPVGCIGCFPGP